LDAGTVGDNSPNVLTLQETSVNKLNRSLVITLASIVSALPAAICAEAAGADTMDPGQMAAPAAAPSSIGQSLLERVRSLQGTWDAQTSLGVITDIFQPFAYDTAVLGEELLNGKQITSTVFYVVNGELRADHYCDYLNQPRYTAVPSVDPNLLDFQFREATNLDMHPLHFHGTQWRIVDATHMVQDWLVLGGKKPVSVAHMEFVKRADGAPLPQPTKIAPVKE
jgi:hypothetical protein